MKAEWDQSMKLEIVASAEILLMAAAAPENQ